MNELAAGLTSVTTPSTLRAWAQQELAKAKGELTATNTKISAPRFDQISPWGEQMTVTADTERNVVTVVWRHSLANGWLFLEIGPPNYTPAKKTRQLLHSVGSGHLDFKQHERLAELGGFRPFLKPRGVSKTRVW